MRSIFRRFVSFVYRWIYKVRNLIGFGDAVLRRILPLTARGKRAILASMETNNTSNVSAVSPSDDDRNPTDRESEELRARILEGADDFAMREGLQPLTMDRLAGHMAMSKKTIYTCFRSKNDLIEALIAHIFSGIAAGLTSIRARTDISAGEKLALTRDTIIERLSRVGARLLDDLSRVFPELWRKVDAKRTALLEEHFAAILREGVAEGSVRETINIDMTVMLIVRTISRVGRPQELIYEPYALSDIVSGLFSLLCTGVLTPEGVHAYTTTEPGTRDSPLRNSPSADSSKNT